VATPVWRSRVWWSRVRVRSIRHTNRRMEKEQTGITVPDTKRWDSGVDSLSFSRRVDQPNFLSLRSLALSAFHKHRCPPSLSISAEVLALHPPSPCIHTWNLDSGRRRIQVRPLSDKVQSRSGKDHHVWNSCGIAHRTAGHGENRSLERSFLIGRCRDLISATMNVSAPALVGDAVECVTVAYSAEDD
jgi:hypothetical protein